MRTEQRTAVLEMAGVGWASSKAVAESVLGRVPGVVAVAVNPVAQTANVTYDPAVTSVAELAGWVRDCGYHCAGASVPDHVCDPMTEPGHPRPHAHPTSHAHHVEAHARGRSPEPVGPTAHAPTPSTRATRWPTPGPQPRRRARRSRGTGGGVVGA